MMRKFESIVISSTEPDVNSTLWLREKKYSNVAGEETSLAGPTIWYFGVTGWEPLIDFDTRVETKSLYTPASKVSPVQSSISYTDSGSVNIELTSYYYDGSGALGNYQNIVLESGLSKQIDALQSQINTLKTRVSALETANQ